MSFQHAKKKSREILFEFLANGNEYQPFSNFEMKDNSN